MSTNYGIPIGGGVPGTVAVRQSVPMVQNPYQTSGQPPIYQQQSPIQPPGYQQTGQPLYQPPDYQQPGQPI